ncbi:MAG: murein biosynthesis integral membrane protein MurJ [Elusimicrobia bacterium]|nr:murein biosynthesis integral membrane protein MurJ [Elusimicrobiota bacterium]
MTVKESSISRAAMIVAGAAILSKALGFVRDIVIALKFGTSVQTDAFLIALTAPEFFIDILAGGALTSAFIPVFSGYLAKEDYEEAGRLFSSIFNMLFIALLLITGLSVINAYGIVRFVAPGFSEETRKLAVRLSYTILPAILFMGLASYLGGVLNSVKKFFLPSMKQAVLNLSIIISALFLSASFKIESLAIGFVAGSVIQFIMLALAMIKRRFRYRVTIRTDHPGLKDIAGMWMPLLLALIFSNAVGIVLKMFASTLPEGRIAALHFAYRLKHLPIVIFGVTLATAIFPFITWHAAQNDMEKFRASVARAVKIIFFITFPLCAGMAVFRVPIIRIIFERGNFTGISTALTASALLFYLPGALAVSLNYVVIRVFYALKDMLTPLKATVAGLLIMIPAGYILKNLLMHSGLALAQSISETSLLAILFLSLVYRSRVLDVSDISRTFLKIVCATAVSVFVAGALYKLSGAISDLNEIPYQLPALAVSFAAAVCVYLLSSKMLKIEESGYLLSTLRKKFFKAG